MARDAEAWRVFRAGDRVRCSCGATVGEVGIGSIVRIRGYSSLPGYCPSPPSFIQRCRERFCRTYYELQVLDENAAAA